MNSRPVLSVIQKACGADRAQNVSAMVDLVVDALDAGADIVLPQELFQGPYFCQTEHQDWFAWACSVDEDPGVAAISKSTKGRGAVVPVSFFERAGQAHYNSVAIVEDGEVLGVYRKSHIPDGPGYEEKFYFNPGDTGFKVWSTRHGTIGVGICWDQWFPESARVMALLGAEIAVLSRPRSAARSATSPTSTPRTCGGARWTVTRCATTCRSSRPTASAPRPTSPSTGRRSSSTTEADHLPRPIARAR